MNRYQRSVIINFATVIIITIVAVIAMVNFKDWVNRSEAMRAMEQLGEAVLQYRKENGFVPSESYVMSIKEDLAGHARLGVLMYRGLWIEPESTEDEILAYTEKKYRSLILSSGFIVLRLDGRVEWMTEEQFKPLLAGQQKLAEIKIQN